MGKKRSFILFEAVLSIALFFIILATTSNLFFKLQEKSKLRNYQSVTLLKLEATQQFLTNNKNFHKLLFRDKKLYYDGNLLLDEVSKYSIGIIHQITTIDICIDNNRVCTQWKIKN